MSTIFGVEKWSQFNNVGAPIAGDIVVGLRAGQNVRFDFPATPQTGWTTLILGQQLAIDSGYIMDNPLAIICPLPLIAPAGSTIQIACIRTAMVTITQGATQQILLGNQTSTFGNTGSMNSTSIGDTITLLCALPNNLWVALDGPQGNWNLT